MPFRLKSAVPQLRNQAFVLPALEQIADHGVTLLAAPPGYVPMNTIMSTLRERQRTPLWLRIGAEDRDPATLLRSLIAAMQQQQHRAGAATLDLMRYKPGPVAGWPLLFASLAAELSQLLGHSGVLVLEDCHTLGEASSTFRLLGTHLLAELPADRCAILLSDRLLPPTALPPQIRTRTIADLRISTQQAEQFVEQLSGQLTSRCIRDSIVLARGRVVVLEDLCLASEVLGPTAIQQAVSRSTGLDDMLSRIAKALFVTIHPDQQQTLAVSLHLGYAHPALLEAALGKSTLPSGPWHEQLEDGWSRPKPLWHPALRSALRNAAFPDRATLGRVGVYLSQQQAYQQAIALFFEIGDRSSAARLIAEVANELMSLGQWATLEELLNQIPNHALEEWPWLVYTHGELAAAQQQIKTAQHSFALASRLFSARHDLQGACQSLLAESTLASWCNDLPLAEARALAANAVAESAGMPWHQSWATWQLGCLAVASSTLDVALTYFERSTQYARAVGDPLIVELPRKAERLTLHQRELQNQREYHRKAYFLAEQAEVEYAEQLRQLLIAPSVHIDSLLEQHRWSQLPLMLKLPVPELTSELADAIGQATVWNKLLGVFSRLRQQPKLATTQPSVAPQSIVTPPRLQTPVAVSTARVAEPAHTSVLFAEVRPQVVWQADSFNHQGVGTAVVDAEPRQPIARAVGEWPQAIPANAELPHTEAQQIMLRAHLLGPFRVTLNDRLVENWPSGRGRSILKYLLTHRKSPVSREVLMDCFWPEVSPEAARNNLNVAIHGLRQAFRMLADPHVVIFKQGAYLINPSISVWLDVEHFEQHIQAGQRLEAAGQLAAAAAAYESGIALYADDFLIDDPNEEWPVLNRERLRVLYFEALDRLSQIAFHQGQYTMCATLCQRILARDSCREDAHCRLMRCYCRQGQHPLALRQYQLCAKELQTHLNLEPATSTTELYERIQQREMV